MKVKYNTFKGIVKSGKPQNVVYTDRTQNIAAAVESDSLIWSFATLHLASRGTTPGEPLRL